MANSNESEKQNQVPNSNKETLKASANLKADQVVDETGFKRVPINVNDESKSAELINLNWYLGIANPVYEKATVKTNVMQNGKKVEKTIEKSVFDHFEFPNVAGDKFEAWLKKNFGDNVKVDDKTKEVYTLVADDAPAPQPTPTEETQPQDNNTPVVDPENN